MSVIRGFGVAYHEGGDGGEVRHDAPAPRIDQQDSNVLPDVPMDWLVDALSRLSAEDRQLALRHRIVPLCWLPNITLYAAVDESGLAHAREHGLQVVGQVAAQDYGTAMRQVLGEDLLKQAVFRLAHGAPQWSAHQRMTAAQASLFSLVLGFCIWFAATQSAGRMFLAISLLASLFFAMVVSVRAFCVMTPLAKRKPPRMLADDALPSYSVLVPLFRETEVLAQLARALNALDYPRHKLDIKLLLEEDDAPMRKAVARLALPAHFEVIVVPRGKPQTKPRALDYALPFARGELLTIYDSEDIPEPDQLRKAAAMFAAGKPELACLQAHLTFYNPNENWLTRQFTAEYAALFEVVLPALASRGYPLLLGGTSNHFKTAVLRQCGAWDAFNVTEDADLGLRLARMGFRTGVLDSKTYEEGNTQLGNWMRQRRRWMKGFMQTWLVHNRAPLRSLRQLGPTGFWVMQCMTLGIFASALLHPFLVAHALWNLSPAKLQLDASSPLTASGIVLNVVMLVMGYAVGLALSQVGLRRLGIANWLTLLWSTPIYWLLMSAAAWLAIWDLIVAPFHWHKTRHGISALTRPGDVKPGSAPRQKRQRTTAAG